MLLYKFIFILLLCFIVKILDFVLQFGPLECPSTWFFTRVLRTLLEIRFMQHITFGRSFCYII